MSFAFGIGIGTQNNQGEWLEVFYQQPVITPDNGLIEVAQNVLDYQGGNQAVSVTPDSSAMICWVLRASRAASSLGRESASSQLLVCRD